MVELRAPLRVTVAPEPLAAGVMLPEMLSGLANEVGWRWGRILFRGKALTTHHRNQHQYDGCVSQALPTGAQVFHGGAFRAAFELKQRAKFSIPGLYQRNQLEL